MRNLVLLAVLVYLLDFKLIEVESRFYEDEYADERPNYNLKDAPELFKKFVKDYGKKYNGTEDWNKHYGYFVKNLAMIIEWNAQKDALFDINEFADTDPDKKSEEEAWYPDLVV